MPDHPVDPTINQMMASLVLQVVRRMVAGTCPFMGLYLDMEAGHGHPDLSHPGDGGATRPPDASGRPDTIGASPSTLHSSDPPDGAQVTRARQS